VGIRVTHAVVREAHDRTIWQGLRDKVSGLIIGERRDLAKGILEGRELAEGVVGEVGDAVVEGGGARLGEIDDGP
jgi:hypothetical protein